MNYARNEDLLPPCSSNAPAYSSIIAISYTNEGAEFISLAEAKAHLRIDASETTFDPQVTDAIKAARNEVEQYLNKSLIKRTITVAMNIANGIATLPMQPIIGTIASVKDTDGNTIESGNYSFNGSVLNLQGYNNAVLTYDAGYTDIAAVPAVFKQGILRLISFDWQHRGDDGQQRSIGNITGLKSYRSVV